MLKDELLFAWWSLSSIQGIGSVALNKIREQLSNCQDLLECSAQDLILFGLKSELAYKWAETNTLDKLTSSSTHNLFLLSGWTKIQQWCHQPNCGVLMPEDPFYPDSLIVLRDAPLFLFYVGDPQLLQEDSIAIVGSRNPTHYGREQAFTIAQQLITSDWHVISGLAIGIDGEAHKGAMHNSTGIGRGKTIAVLGSGLAEIYPKRHQELAREIVSNGGLLLSEYLPDEKALAKNFPRRNRIVSGLSRGTLVIEAAIKSGSLITARLAAEQGREVFALPGAVINPLSKGCHQLIKEGANLIENAADILALLNSDLAHDLRAANLDRQKDLFAAKSLPSSIVGDVAKQIYQALDVVPTAVDTLVNRTGLSVAEITQQLILMELKGQVNQVPGGYIRM
jgi:DNA processing protein